MNIDLTWLQGYKTYIIATLVALVAASQYMGWLTPELAAIFYGLLGAGGMASMAAKINRNNG